jgi:two-component system OmpR family response regulator
MDHVYDRNDERDSNVIDVLIGRIRKKVGQDLIHTQRGQGWRVAPPDEG